jgi:hypothetical protein
VNPQPRARCAAGHWKSTEGTNDHGVRGQAAGTPLQSTDSPVRGTHGTRKRAHTNEVGVPNWPDEGPPTPEGPWQRSSSSGLPDPDRIVIPDDIRELEPDIRLYYREVSHRRYKELLRRVFLTRRWERFGLSGPVVVCVLCIVALFGSLASVLVPRSTERPERTPLAAPSIPVAAPGGLLPDVKVSLYGDVQDIRERRPNVIALVPEECPNCADILDLIYGQAKTEGLRFDIIGAPDRERQLRAIDRATGNGAADVLLDEDDALAKAYGPGVLTILVVAPDGIVVQILRDPKPGDGIEESLRRLYRSTTA